jgi:hypothetical protein
MAEQGQAELAQSVLFERIKLFSKAYFPAREGLVRKIASKTDKGFGPWAFTKD